MRFNEAFDPFRALSSSWKAIKQAPVPLLVGGGLLVLTGGGGGGGGMNFATDPKSFEQVNWEAMLPFLLAVGALGCCIGIGFFIFSSWVKVGFANTVEEVVRTGQGDVGRIFEAKGRLWPMVLSRLLVAVISTVALLPYALVFGAAALATEGFERDEGLGLVIGIVGFLVYLPVYLYIVLGLALSDQAVALEGAQPVESLRRSWSLVRGHRWMLLWYSIVTGIFSALGVCLCCIGIFLTGSMTLVAWSESFLALTRGNERGSWWIQTGHAPLPAAESWGTPPPPPAPV